MGRYLSINLQYAFEQPLGERRAGNGHPDLTRQFQGGRQTLGENLGALPSNSFRFLRSFEPLPCIQHVALAGTDMQDFLKGSEVQPGLVTKQLALMGPRSCSSKPRFESASSRWLPYQARPDEIYGWQR